MFNEHYSYFIFVQYEQSYRYNPCSQVTKSYTRGLLWL